MANYSYQRLIKYKNVVLTIIQMPSGRIESIAGNHPRWRVLSIMIICLRPMLLGKHSSRLHFRIGRRSIIGKFKI